MDKHYRVFLSMATWLAVAVALTFQAALADSPPNLSADIPWTDSGGSGPNAAYGGVDDIELAFNNARRQEEIQLGIPPGQLGVLDLPAQSVWEGLSADQKALVLINAERQARANMMPNVLGLPLAAVETNLDQTAQAYAELLVATNTFGHFQPSNDPLVDNPQIRLSNTPVIRDCMQKMARSENLAAFWTTNPPILLPIERSIYGWLYVDARSDWGHREAVLLQEKTLAGASFGFTNDAPGDLHEGFLGIGHAGAPGYNPFGSGGQTYGEVVVMNIVDPPPAEGCPTDAGLSQLSISLAPTTDLLPQPGELISVTLQVTNTGPTVLTNLLLTHTIPSAYLAFVSASLPPTSIDTGNEQVVWQQAEQSLPFAMMQPGQQWTVNLLFEALAVTPVDDPARLLLEANAAGGWGGAVAPSPANTTLTIAQVNVDQGTTPEDEPIFIDVLANDSPGLAIGAVDTPQHGSAAIQGGQVTYTPAQDFYGVDHFTYAARSVQGQQATVAVTVTVTPVNDPPTFTSAPPQEQISAGQLFFYPVLTADVDLDDAHTIVLTTGPTWLTLLDQPNGTVVLSGTPPDDFEGEEPVVITVTDSSGATAVQSFTLTVTPAQKTLHLPLVQL